MKNEKDFGVKEFVAKILEPKGPVPGFVIMGDVYTELVIQAVRLAKGNVTHAARKIQLQRTTVVEHIRKRGLQSEVAAIRALHAKPKCAKLQMLRPKKKYTRRPASRMAILFPSKEAA